MEHAQGDIQARTRPEIDQQDRDGLEHRDQGRRRLAGAEDPERPARGFERIDIAEDDPAEQVGERSADDRGDECR